MKSLFIKLLITAFVISLPSLTIAAQYDSIVIGKGDPHSDVMAVQTALDKGGSVLLKGTFDFGKDGKVKISKDVNIYGETDTQGIPVTKIQGGFWTFQSTLPEQLPIRSPGPKIGIQQIHFDGAAWSPIFLPYCGGAEIINNKISVLPAGMRNRKKFSGAAARDGQQTGEGSRQAAAARRRAMHSGSARQTSGRLIFPGQKVVGRLLDLLGVFEQPGQIGQRVDPGKLAGVDQAHEQIAHLSAALGLVKQGVFAM
jgi:hypothetical protein